MVAVSPLSRFCGLSFSPVHSSCLHIKQLFVVFILVSSVSLMHHLLIVLIKCFEITIRTGVLRFIFRHSNYWNFLWLKDGKAPLFNPVFKCVLGNVLSLSHLPVLPFNSIVGSLGMLLCSVASELATLFSLHVAHCDIHHDRVSSPPLCSVESRGC